MRIRFEIGIEDVIALNRFHVANSPTIRRQMRMQAILVSAVFMAAFLWQAWTLETDDLLFAGLYLGIMGLVYVLIAAGCLFLLRRLAYSCFDRNLRKLLAEGSNRAILGWRELEMADNRLVLETELIQSHIDLRAIEKILGNDDYTFIYLGTVDAHIIPMQRSTEGDAYAFVAELRTAWEKIRTKSSEA